MSAGPPTASPRCQRCCGPPPARTAPPVRSPLGPVIFPRWRCLPGWSPDPPDLEERSDQPGFFLVSPMRSLVCSLLCPVARRHFSVSEDIREARVCLRTESPLPLRWAAVSWATGYWLVFLVWGRGPSVLRLPPECWGHCLTGIFPEPPHQPGTGQACGQRSPAPSRDPHSDGSPHCNELIKLKTRLILNGNLLLVHPLSA